MKPTQTRRRTKSRKGFRRSGKTIFIPPQSVDQFFAMSEPNQDLWRNSSQVVTELRAGASLRQASRKFDLDPRTVLRLVRPALRKQPNGRWAAKKSDRLLRVLPMPTLKGLIDIGVSDSRQASLVGKYWNAVDLYLGTGDSAALRFFQGKFIVGPDGREIYFMTDANELDHLASAGQLSFESLYARVA
jgi:hypothetical protein